MNSGFWLRAARWLIMAYVIAQLGLMLAGVALFPSYARAHLDSDALTPNVAWHAGEVQAALKELGWPATTVAWLALARDLVSTLVVYLVLVMLLWRRPNSWFGLFVALVFALEATLGGTGFLPLFERLPALATASDVLGPISWQLFFILFYLFPNGRPVPGWTRWLAWVWGCFVAFQVVTLGRVPTIFGPDVNPVVAQVGLWVMIGFVLIAIGSQVYRYFRQSDAVQRQQTKWVVYALALMAAMVALVAPRSFRGPGSRLGQDLILAIASSYAVGLIFTLVIAAVGLAILRYRLWDIDVLIRRTLIYSVLTSLLALAYFGSVIVLGNIFRTLTGQAQSPLVTVISTLAIAALFVPLRSRVQAFIDRRFFRRKYDAARTLAAFATSARDQVELDVLTRHLLAVVQDTLQPASASLILWSAALGTRPTMNRLAAHSQATAGAVVWTKGETDG